jgi:hypothetical protein
MARSLPKDAYSIISRKRFSRGSTKSSYFSKTLTTRRKEQLYEVNERHCSGEKQDATEW